MNINELFTLTTWIDQEVVAKQIQGLYQNLFNTVQQNTQPNRAKVPFENERKNLEMALAHVPVDQLSNEQSEVLGKLGIAKHVGQDGIAALDDLFTKNALDIATVAQRLQGAINDIGNGVNRAKQIRDGLQNIIDTSDVPANLIVLKINFVNEASINNVSDFKEWASIWFDIGRGVALVHNLTPQDIRVIGAAKGSILLELTTAYVIVATISKIVIRALDITRGVLAIRVEMERLRGLQLSNSRIIEDLQKEADQKKQQGAESIANEFIAELEISAKKDGEAVNAFRGAVKKLVDFLDKGGQVDCVVPSKGADGGESSTTEISAEQRQSLEHSVEEMRRLVNVVKELEHKRGDK